MYNYNYYPEQIKNQTPPPTYTPSPSRTGVGYQYQQPLYLAGLKGRPVSSIEEAKASSIDFDGSVFFFPDLANKRIYTKQINMDGTATLSVYELQDIPVDPPMINTNNFITREEFETVINQLRNAAISVMPQQSEPQTVQKQEVKPF